MNKNRKVKMYAYKDYIGIDLTGWENPSATENEGKVFPENSAGFTEILCNKELADRLSKPLKCADFEEKPFHIRDNRVYWVGKKTRFYCKFDFADIGDSEIDTLLLMATIGNDDIGFTEFKYAIDKLGDD